MTEKIISSLKMFFDGCVTAKYALEREINREMGRDKYAQNRWMGRR